MKCTWCGVELTQHASGRWVDDSGSVTCHRVATGEHEPGVEPEIRDAMRSRIQGAYDSVLDTLFERFDRIFDPLEDMTIEEKVRLVRLSTDADVADGYEEWLSAG